ncbi:MAG: DUF4062 domain-containing protein [Dehalococcoidia bacterium]|nr:DUF4062 domain-containing protein [Dehalococcoidia bacterium]
MGFTAQVYNVLISSPGDVLEEGTAVRSVIDEWNALNAEEQRVVLLPMSWQTHATPQMGVRPQGAINEQLLNRADVVVAIFWTRLGTPTGEAPSGTVEELREHMSRGKPTLLYFSNAPVEPTRIEPQQYEALRAFRAEIRTEGLVDDFGSVAEFEQKFRSHLHRTVTKKLGAVDAQPVPEPRTVELTGYASDLLVEASQDQHGHIMVSLAMGPYSQVSTNGREFLDDPSSPRERQRWIAAIEQLEELDLIRPSGLASAAEGGLFMISERGYTAVEASQ